MRVFSAAYLTTLGVTVVVTAALTAAARLRPGRWVIWADGALAGMLLAVTGAWFASTFASARFSPATSLPLALCDLGTLVASAALLTRARLLVELTYFWGLAGTLQSLLTPDLSARFPSLVFFEYVLAHGGIVCAAVLLVAGQHLVPRRRAVPRILGITLAYSAFVGIADALTGGDYMYLRRPPGNWTLLKVLGPWPWYIASATAVAAVLFTLLDLPFWRQRAAGERAMDEASSPPRPLPRSRRVGPSRL